MARQIYGAGIVVSLVIVCSRAEFYGTNTKLEGTFKIKNVYVKHTFVHGEIYARYTFTYTYALS